MEQQIIKSHFEQAMVDLVNLYKPEWDIDFYPRQDEEFVRMVEDVD